MNAMTLPTEVIDGITITIDGEYGKGYYTMLSAQWNDSPNGDPFHDRDWEEEVGCFDTMDDAKDEARSRIDYLSDGGY